MRWRVTVITRRDGRRWPYQLKITDRLTRRVIREVVRGATLRQKRRAYERAAERERQLNGLAQEILPAPSPWPEAKGRVFEYLGTRLRPESIGTYRRILDLAQAYVATKLWGGLRFTDDVTGPLAEGYAAWRQAHPRRGQKVEAVTINRDLAHLAAFWGHLVRLGLAAENPWAGASRLKVFRAGRVRLTFAQRRRLLAAAAALPLDLHAAVALAADCGPRIQELAHVTWPHLDLSARTWLVTREPCGWQPKSGRARVLRFGEAAAGLLTDWRPARIAKVIASTDGASSEEVRQVVLAGRVFGRGASPLHDPWERDFTAGLGRACVAASVPVVTCHGLRRTIGRLAKEAGAAPLDIRDLLGHADFRTTEGYIGEGQADGAAAAFEAFSRGAQGAKQVPQPPDSEDTEFPGEIDDRDNPL